MNEVNNLRLVVIRYPERRLEFFREQLAAANRRLDWSMKHNPDCDDHAQKGEAVSCYEWAVKLAEAEDVSPIVRCGNCKNYHEETGWCTEHSHFIDSDRAFCHPWESAEWKMFDPDYFCADGVRKDGDTDEV